jgi:hypothetical protein
MHPDPFVRPTIVSVLNHRIFKMKLLFQNQFALPHPSFNVKDYLVQQKKFSPNNIFQINQLDDTYNNYFKNFKHIYLINENNQQVQDISFFDISNSCCILIHASLRSIPKRYFFDNPRIRKDKRGNFKNVETKPLEGFSLNLITLHFYSDIDEIEKTNFFGCESLQ